MRHARRSQKLGETVRDYASAENEELRAEFPEIEAYDYF